jgi:lycopene cyclase domain-containing protein
MEHYLYLFLNLLSISYPVYKSFDKRVDYYKHWKYVVIAIIPMLIYMITWDVIFTKYEVWGFNPNYNMNFYFLGLPIEEWLFFICVPFASLFIYEVVIYYDKNDSLKKYSKPISILLILIASAFIIFGFNQIYTLVTGVSLLLLLLIHLFILKTHNTYLGRFYVAFIFILIPFFVINGTLTGAFISDEIVWYNMEETFGIRLSTIPFEDILYCIFMMLLTTTFYEFIKKKKIT